VWLSPIHPSPNRDWGYDVADYHAVQHDYGTLEDFQRLLDAAHAKGLKIILDEVLAHTSDEHEWFKDSMRRGDKADWYVWADPGEDGTAPNNWLSAFGGPAWAYQPARRQHYHHKFLRQQPKLNWRNPDAKAAALQVLDFWLAKGVDGFRLDVANAYLHDDTLTDNPAVPVPQRTKWHWSHAANLQEHWHDSNLVENVEVLAEVREVVDRYPDRFVFGEFSEEAGRCGGFASSDEGLHAGYSFPLLIANKLSPAFIRKHFAELEQHADHWPCISFSNHDVPRTLTRFGGKDAPPERARMMLALLLTLRGTTLLYQGEELGLPEADLTREQLRDPVGDLYWPVHKGRDGCRTPMPWGAGPTHGFTTGTPWLPAAPEHDDLTVEKQEADAGSTLALTRKLIALRRDTPALRLGEIRFRDTQGPVLAFERDGVLCAFNMSGETAQLPADGETLLEQTGPYGFRIARL
jgi:alpha-glucosidase